ncbi:COMM domain-containing protein 5 [Drosophila gunungcola]|uniref:COMM domain-containing protein 5 n=1 Tax=Drosophila elegans TaxID=30023 RepID=UPI0007E7301B|nr:COMM domain-containing protein 5 [Drosophila elegans]XP_052854511.1 COMM domain-containing protein 5 [Drosophila gunungcola]
MSSSFRYNLLRSVKPYTPFTSQLTKSMLRVLIQVSVHFIETEKSSSEVLSLALNKITNAGHQIPPNFCELFTMVFLMLQIFLKYPKGVVKHHELRNCLMDDLNFTDEYADDICKVLLNHRDILSKNFFETKIDRVKMTKFQWRINISLSLNTVQIDKPTIVLHFKLQNREFRTLELPLSMFQQVRYNIALLLNELNSLQRRTALK